MGPRRKGRNFRGKPKKKPQKKSPSYSGSSDDESSRSGSSSRGSSDCSDDGSDEASQSDEDDPRDYKKGGYHPVEPYQLYSGRYRTLCKLGAGAFSTVWLCTDERTVPTLEQDAEASAGSSAQPGLVAMKVCKSKKSVTEQAIDEIALFEKIQENGGSAHVSRLSSHFWHQGPHGRHKCMCFEVMGENLLTIVKHYDYSGLPHDMVQRIARHTLLGLAFIHSKGIIHTDVKLENVLITRHDMPQLLEDAGACFRAFREQQQKSGLVPGANLSKSQKKKMKKKAKAKSSQVVAAGPDDGSDGEGEGTEPSKPVPPPARQKERLASLESSRIFAKLADFGNGCEIDRKITDDIQTRQYRSPEIIIGADWDATADCWSAACMFFELITGDFLFDPRTGDDWSRDEDHLALMIELLGSFPRKAWVQLGRYSKEFFQANAKKLKHIKTLKMWPMHKVLQEKYSVDEKLAMEISGFLLPMLAWEPKERQSAKDALSHSWIRRSGNVDPLEEEHAPNLNSADALDYERGATDEGDQVPSGESQEVVATTNTDTAELQEPEDVPVPATPPWEPSDMPPEVPWVDDPALQTEAPCEQAALGETIELSTPVDKEGISHALKELSEAAEPDFVVGAAVDVVGAAVPTSEEAAAEKEAITGTPLDSPRNGEEKVNGVGPAGGGAKKKKKKKNK